MAARPSADFSSALADQAERHSTTPFTAWCTAAVFGTLMFMSNATTYAANLQFRLKFVCMGLAALNMLSFRFGPYRRVALWDSDEPPVSAKLAGALSLSLWIGVVFFGRWTGFTMT